MIKYLIYDTETTGLNIRTDKPFLYQYGLVDDKLDLIELGVFEATNLQEKQQFIHHLQTVPTIVGHNIKFDIHMAINDGIDIDIFKNKNYIDTSVLARLVIPHDTQSDKTFSTALKKLGVRYLGIDSADEERKLKMELSRLTHDHKMRMLQYFIDQGVWTPAKTQTTETKRINEVYNKWNKIYHKYPALKKARRDFLKMDPPPTYQDVSNVKTYGKTDIKLTHGLLRLWYPKIVPLKQVNVFKRISNAVMPLVLMERKGMTVDIPRIIQDRNAILREQAKTKIIDPRTGDELSIGQHAKLKELYEYESGLSLNSADKEARAEVEDSSPAARAANYLSKMDKMLNTYITGILNKLTYIDGEYKVFTQYNLAGTITGRLSSDFQQFPKEPLVLDDGYEVNIRSWFIVPKQDKYMFYFDYSQMELRLQCEWTSIVNGEPDINMARAFMPYKCIEKNGKYYLEEEPTKEWKPIDLHTSTASHAFPNIPQTHPDWKNHYRQLGKRANFAINYGAAAPKLVSALKVDFATARALVEGYKKTFAGVVAFGNWIKKRVYITDNIPNLMLRRYYSRNKHQLQNWLVQGSGADILLLKLFELWKYLEDKPHWNFMITVHDEVGFTCTDIPMDQLLKEVDEIQKLMCHALSAVDIISDVEVTTTKWSEKIDWDKYLKKLESDNSA